MSLRSASRLSSECIAKSRSWIVKSPLLVSHGAPWAVEGARRGAHKKHRQIAVQLLVDMPGLGGRGTVCDVAPGYMRNLLKPKRFAAYLGRDGQPLHAITPVLDTPTVSRLPAVDITILKDRLSSLRSLTFYRHLQTPESDPSPTLARSSLGAPSPVAGKRIFGSVSLQDVAKLLETEHGLSLVAPDAIIQFRDGETKLKETGQDVVEVHLRNGDIIPLRIDIRDQEAETLTFPI